MARISEDGFNKEKDLEKISTKVVFQPFYIQKLRLFFVARILIHGVRKRGRHQYKQRTFSCLFFQLLTCLNII